MEYHKEKKLTLNILPRRNTFFSRNSYLLVTAAWLITISFIIDNYWSRTSTRSSVQRAIQNDIQDHQKNFESLCRDTFLIKKLAAQNYSEETIKDLTEKKYFIFLYQVN